MSAKKLLAIGELLWDVMPNGRHCGGASANVVYHARRLGMEAAIATALGRDKDGEELLAFLASKEIPTGFIVRNDLPTGLVTVQLQDGKPSYIIHQPSAWDAIFLNDAARAFLHDADALYFGSLAQREETSRKTIQEAAKILRSSSSKALVVFDINLRQHFFSQELLDTSLRLCHLLKLSDEELPVLRDLFGLPANEQEALQALLQVYQLRAILYTKGAEGSAYLDGDRFFQIPAKRVKVADTVGCGDSFLAAFLSAHFQGKSPEKALDFASEIAAQVASHPGAM